MAAFYKIMASRSEQPSQAPIEERLRSAFEQSVQPLANHIYALGETHFDRFSTLFDGIASNGMLMFWGTKRYDEDMERAGGNAMRRPFGIEMRTLSPSTQLVLYPTTVYKPDDGTSNLAKEEGLEPRTQGAQTMVYLLDEFEAEAGNTYDLAANLLFVSHMVGAALNNRYPLDQGERSPEFLEEVKAGLTEVKEYISDLPFEQRDQLSPHIVRVGVLDEDGLKREAQRIALYDAEAMKMPGLYDPEAASIIEQTPEEAVSNGTLYLHLDERGLPQRERGETTTDVPSLPWTEYGRNRWNRSHQLFGRYENPTTDGSLRVDFRLDSEHIPTIYGFLDTIEISKTTAAGIREHILFGQEMGEKAHLLHAQFLGANFTLEELQDSVIPIIIAGDFDFTNRETRELLGKLAADQGTKLDVGRVIADVLRLSEQGELKRVIQDEVDQK